jgi:Tol biopolymer transport system component
MIISEPKQLTHLNAQFNSVVFSPDSRHIAFSCVSRRRGAVGLMDVGGDGKAVLLAGRDNKIDDAYYDLQFSPDGTFLIACFAVEDGEFADLCRIDIATRKQTRLTTTRRVMRPCLSPNGRDIVFEERQNGPTNLYRVCVDGGETTRLTNTQAVDETPLAINGFARYSPDGNRIAFVASKRKRHGGEPNGPSQIFVMDADGSNVNRLTDLPNDCDYPMWHPDNNRIVFTVQTDFVGEEKKAHSLWKYRTNFYIVEAGDGEAEQKPPRCLEPSHSVKWLDSIHPSGRWIAYSSYCEERFKEGWRNWDIRVLDTETGEVLIVTDDDIYDTDPLFSPDGKLLLFVSERNNEKRHKASGDNRMQTHGSDLYLIQWEPTL